MSLDVGGNNIGAKGITALANALRGNENLKSLELGYNPIHEKGAQALADVVKYDLKVTCMQCDCPVPLTRQSEPLKRLLRHRTKPAVILRRGYMTMSASSA